MARRSRFLDFLLGGSLLDPQALVVVHFLNEIALDVRLFFLLLFLLLFLVFLLLLLLLLRLFLASFGLFLCRLCALLLP